MTRCGAGIIVAFMALALAGPSYGASRFVALIHVKLGIRIDAKGLHQEYKTSVTPDSASLSSENDQIWQLTVNNCVLDVGLDDAHMSAADIRYKKSFEKGAADASAPHHDQLLYVGRAEVAGHGTETTDQPIACDAQHIYWLSVLRSPSLPGKVAVMLLIYDGYKYQDTEERMILFAPETFLDGDKKTAQDIGGVTEAIAKAMQ